MKVLIKKKTNTLGNDEMICIKKFIRLLQSKLPLNHSISIIFTNNRTGVMTTGVRKPNNEIKVLFKGRLLIDILRTLSHEWVHEYQHQKLNLDNKKKIQDIGGPEENMANTLSGILVKLFAKKHPETENLLYNE